MIYFSKTVYYKYSPYDLKIPFKVRHQYVTGALCIVPLLVYSHQCYRKGRLAVYPLNDHP